MKIYDKKLAYPYFVWMTLFTVAHSSTTCSRLM